MTTIFGEMNKNTDLSGLVYEPIAEKAGDPDANSVVGRLTRLDGKVEDLERNQIFIENEITEDGTSPVSSATIYAALNALSMDITESPTISEKITLNNLSSDDTSGLTDDADPASIIGRIAAIESELSGLNTALENMIGSQL